MMITSILIALVAGLHFFFLYVEMFLWTKPFGLKNFKLTPETAAISAPLAANMGLYNGFLGTGLIWSLCHPDVNFGRQLALFFLSCVIIAAIYGAYSASRSILIKQGLPAVLAMLSLLFLG